MAALMLRSNSTTVSFGQSLFLISSRETIWPWRRRSICKIWNCCSGRRTFLPFSLQLRGRKVKFERPEAS